MLVIPAHPIEWLQQEITFKFADRAEVPGWLGIDVQSEARLETMAVKYGWQLWCCNTSW